MHTSSRPDLIPSAEVCERIGIDRSTLSRWVAFKRITPVLQLPGKNGAFLFDPDDVERLAAEIAGKGEVSA